MDCKAQPELQNASGAESGREGDQRVEGLGFPGRKAEGKERGGRGEKVLKLRTLRTYKVSPERLERWLTS